MLLSGSAAEHHLVHSLYHFLLLLLHGIDVQSLGSGGQPEAVGCFCSRYPPGQQTANYIDGVLTRLTIFGSAYIALVCLLPQFLVVAFNVPFYLGGTSMLIVVVVVMDFMAQVQSHLMSHQYEGVMKQT